MIEHYGMEPGEDAYSSRTYSTKSHITNFIWNNVSYHNEHHKFPGIPFYNLRSFHEAAFPYYDARVQSECYDNMWGIAFQLWGRILRLDIAKLDEKYAALDKQAEESRLMNAPGIDPGIDPTAQPV
jgi:fatty acid desaturase